MNPSKLYLVATPIGNLQDITLRATHVLKEVDFVACEDTRKTSFLLKSFDIQKPLMSLFKGKETIKSQKVLERILEGQSCALVSDSGTPNIQDPGFELVRMCLDHEIQVIPIPGPCAVISALSASGLPTHSFIFEGFLPVKNGPKRRKMESWKCEERTIVFYESPYKIERTLRDLEAVLGDIQIVVARELTKKFEEIIRNKVSAIIKRFEQNKPKGEFVILLNLCQQDKKGNIT
jgi:16S rRNA (cytidine1402-2'-O)-methyltransferase